MPQVTTKNAYQNDAIIEQINSSLLINNWNFGQMVAVKKNLTINTKSWIELCQKFLIKDINSNAIAICHLYLLSRDLQQDVAGFVNSDSGPA